MKYEIIEQEVVAGSDNPTKEFYTAFMLNCSAVVVADGTENGALKFQASNDNSSPLDGNRVTNWVDIPTKTVSIAGAGNYVIPVFDTCYMYMRAVYTHASGSGNISFKVKAMGF